jgi:hypothetical protein
MKKAPTAREVTAALRWWSISFADLPPMPIYTSKEIIDAIAADSGATAEPISQAALHAIGDTVDLSDDGIN